MSDWKNEIMDRVAKNMATHDDLKHLYSAAIGDYVLEYDLFMYEKFGLANAFSRFPLGSSFPFETKYSRAILSGMDKAINQLCLDLLDDLDARTIEGAIVEFGVARGRWLKRILQHLDERDAKRTVFGFTVLKASPNRTEIMTMIIGIRDNFHAP